MTTESTLTGRLLLTPKEAAAALAISERKLRYLAKDGGLPFVPMGRLVRYDPIDLAEWIRRQKQTASAAAVI